MIWIQIKKNLSELVPNSEKSDWAGSKWTKIWVSLFQIKKSLERVGSRLTKLWVSWIQSNKNLSDLIQIKKNLECVGSKLRKIWASWFRINKNLRELDPNQEKSEWGGSKLQKIWISWFQIKKNLLDLVGGTCCRDFLYSQQLISWCCGSSSQFSFQHPFPGSQNAAWPLNFPKSQNDLSKSCQSLVKIRFLWV